LSAPFKKCGKSFKLKLAKTLFLYVCMYIPSLSKSSHKCQTELQDGIFLYQKIQFGYSLEGLEMENVAISYSHLENFMDIWYILWPFCTVCCHWYIFPCFGMLHL
jgi:hypothetical protein